MATARRAIPGQARRRCVEVDRLVNSIGGVTLLNRLILVGSPLAGQRARIRLDGQLMGRGLIAKGEGQRGC